MPVVVSGIPELKRALKQFAPDLRKQMDAEIRTALKEVIVAAEAKVPGNAPGGLYNWQDNGVESVSRTSKFRPFPKYNSSEIKDGLTYSLGARKRNSQGFSGLYSLFNKSAAGMIVEWAGRIILVDVLRWVITAVNLHRYTDAQTIQTQVADS